MAPLLTLYGYARSLCTMRLRIALALKHIDHDNVYVDFVHKAHRDAAYAAINPSLTVPTLAVVEVDGSVPVYITQSVAALEYLEEAFPDSAIRLLPEVPVLRARVRSLVAVLAGDLQPRQSLLTLERLGTVLGADTTAQAQWAREWCERELGAYEQIVRAGDGGDGEGGMGDKTAPRFSVGNELSLADVCLVPAVQNAVDRWAVDVDGLFPTIAVIYAHVATLPEVRASHWSKQPDALVREAGQDGAAGDMSTGYVDSIPAKRE